MIFNYETPDGARVKGTVKIKLPKYTERLQYLRDCNFNLSSDGEIEIDDNMLGATIKMIQIAGKHVESVDLVTEAGKEIKSFDEMEYEPACEPILQELGNIVLNGAQVGNDSKPI